MILMLNPISTKLKELNLNNPVERLIYQVMDLSLIRNRVIDSGLYAKENIIPVTDNLILDWEWLYSIGLSLDLKPQDKMNDNQIQRYEEFTKRFDEFNKYMKSNKSILKKDIRLLD